MVRSILTNGEKHSGPNSSWQRHNDRGGRASLSTGLSRSWMCLGTARAGGYVPAHVAALIGPGDRKSVRPMAVRDKAVNYDRLHHFIGSSVWDAAPLETALLVEADGAGWRRGCLVDHRRHRIAEERPPLGWRCAARCLCTWQDRPLSVAGFGCGRARGACDGRISVRQLEGRSQTHGAGPCTGGSTGRTDKA